MNLEGRRVAITRLCEPVCRYPTSGPKPASHQRGSLGRSGANWSFPGVETDTSEQVLKFAPKEKAPNRVAQLDDAGQAIVAKIRTAADLAKEDCDRAIVLHTSFPWNSERPKTEHSKWRGRLSTGKTEQPAPNNGFGRSSKRLKRNCSLGDHSPGPRRPQSVSLDQTSPPAVSPADRKPPQ